MYIAKSSKLKLYVRGVDQVYKMKKYRRCQKLRFYIYQLVTSVFRVKYIIKNIIMYLHEKNYMPMDVAIVESANVQSTSSKVIIIKFLHNNIDIIVFKIVKA